MARVTRYNVKRTVNKSQTSQPTQGTVAPSGARPEPTFIDDVAVGAVNVGKSFVNPNRSQEDYEAWSQGKELQNKPLAELGIGTLSGQYTKEEVYEETERRVKEEPGKVVGEVAVEGALAIVPGSKVQKLGKIGTDVLKQKLGHSVAGWTDTPKPQSTGKILDLDVNKLNREIDVAKTKVRDEDIMVSPRGNESYSPTNNPMEPRSHVDKYYENLADQQVSGKNPANWTESSVTPKEVGTLNYKGEFVPDEGQFILDKTLAKRFAASDPKKLREFFGEKTVFDEGVKSQKEGIDMVRGMYGKADWTDPAISKNIKNEGKRFDVDIAEEERRLLKWNKQWTTDSEKPMDLMVRSYKKPNSDPSMGVQIVDIFPRDKQFYKGDKFLTGAGATAGGLGIFGLGGRKNDKTN